MTATLVPSRQSDALTREIERQVSDECRSIVATAERETHEIIARARASARARLRNAIKDLRREAAERIGRAKAQMETELRRHEQRRAAESLNEAMPLLHQALVARWAASHCRQVWTHAVARLGAARLRKGPWLIEHPNDWTAAEQQAFAAAIGLGRDVDPTFQVVDGLSAGLRIKADQATLDATPEGLLVDRRTIAAILLAEIMGERIE